ncbi:hypothetical protein [Cohnella cholangitidis]|uniref:hypothetical protein n=1 Tax=Cohnella cholangitidis TaxID=2598458 RepID=UPI001E48CEE8|nr:hypothetical protein [Cohnella cholangitidis]
MVTTIMELRKRFSNADPDFGPLPFWWWSAEEITAERVRWQLQKFRSGGLRNIGIINIAPTGPQYGSVSDNPVHYSERWWTMFEIALREAERLGMRLYFYDQIGFSGSNIPSRLVTENPEYAGYCLRRLPINEPLPEGAKVFLETEDYRYATVRQGFNWLDPVATASLLKLVHGEFERRFPNDLGKTLGGSFQDELPPLPLWTAELPAKYKLQYGEDIHRELPALFDDLPNSAIVRRRVYKLAAELAEQSLFIPLAQWHEKYGMLLCCDQADPRAGRMCMARNDCIWIISGRIDGIIRRVATWTERLSRIRRWYTFMAANAYFWKLSIRAVGAERSKRRYIGSFLGCRRASPYIVLIPCITAREGDGGSGHRRIPVGASPITSTIRSSRIRSAESVRY